jgi:hypothetical protein
MVLWLCQQLCFSVDCQNACQRQLQLCLAAVCR